jgi:hypothetical protein
MTREELQVFIKMPGITKQKLEKIINWKKFEIAHKFISHKFFLLNKTFHRFENFNLFLNKTFNNNRKWWINFLVWILFKLEQENQKSEWEQRNLKSILNLILSFISYRIPKNLVI